MITLGVVLLSCAGEAGPSVPVPVPVPVEVPAAAVVAPEVAFAVGTRDARTNHAIAKSPALVRVRGILEGVVTEHARDASNPWAVVHGMLALGPTMRLADGSDPVDTLFSTVAIVKKVGDTELVAFPARVGDILVEPHTDLILKALTENGFAPERAITVQGRPFTLGDYYRHSLWRSWFDRAPAVKGRFTSFQQGGYNDTPWALQGLAAWAPAGLGWTAEGGHALTLSDFTTAVADQLEHETREMAAAHAAGALVQKDTRKGLFRYTCGGQHLFQGLAYAVGRGFGSDRDKARVCEQTELLAWRIDVELNAVDPHLAAPDATRGLQIVLLTQRLKFLGHYLESTAKVSAMGLCPVDVAASERVAAELVRTVDALGALGIWADVGAVRGIAELEALRQNGGQQVYLDLVGDSAHALRGIDLATGTATLRY